MSVREYDWRVYLVNNCQHTTPPKSKYVLIFDYEADGYLGFLINSEVHPFIQKRPHLIPCIAEIPADTNSYLDYDSNIDCRMMYPFSIHDLYTHVGDACEVARTNVMKAIMACPVLEIKKKGILIDRYQDYTSPV